MQGQHIINVNREEITVLVGKDQCVVEAAADTVITCIAPQRDEPVIESVTVRRPHSMTSQSNSCDFRCHLDRISTTVLVSLSIVLSIPILLLLLEELLVEFYLQVLQLT